MTHQIDNLKQSALDWINQLVELKQSYTPSQLSSDAELLDKFMTAKTKIAEIRSEISNLESPRHDERPGSYLISLLNSGLDEDLTPTNYLQDIYKIAEFWLESDPSKVHTLSCLGLSVCQNRLDLDTDRVLVANDKKNLKDITDVDQLKTGRGKFYLLQAALLLNHNKSETKKEDWLQVLKLLEDSIDQFKGTSWFQLTSLAYLGLAIVNQQLSNPDEAEHTCNQALRYALQESIVARINTDRLEEAIREQQISIEALRDEETEHSKNASLTGDEAIYRDLPLFKASQGQGCITGDLITRLNLLSRQDYEVTSATSAEKVVIDQNQFDTVRSADYILEIGSIARVENGLTHDDWLLINTEVVPERLHGRTVAVLITSDNQLQIGLRKFTKTDDHYFLEPFDNAQPCIVLAEYETEFNKVDHYYNTFNRAFELKKAYEIQISGEVIEHISHDTKNEAIQSYIWQIPIVSDISAGIGIIAREDIIDYLEIRDPNRIGPSFGVQVVGDSMNKDGIFDKQIAVIQKRPSINQGDIAAVVVFTPDFTEPLGVIKRYYVVQEQNDTLRHWLLESSNPASQHIVVIPAGGDGKKVRDIYEKRLETGKIKKPIFYKDGEIVVVGKFVKSVQA